MKEQDIINILKEKGYKRKDNHFRLITGEHFHHVILTEASIQIYGKADYDGAVVTSYNTGFIDRPTLKEYEILLV